MSYKTRFQAIQKAIEKTRLKFSKINTQNYPNILDLTKEKLIIYCDFYNIVVNELHGLKL